MNMDIETKLSELVATLQAIEKHLQALDEIKKTLNTMDESIYDGLDEVHVTISNGLANVSEQISYCHG